MRSLGCHAGFNERDTIEEIIRRVIAVPVRTELIVVDDGSTDGRGISWTRCRGALFKLVLQPTNGGKGPRSAGFRR